MLDLIIATAGFIANNPGFLGSLALRHLVLVLVSLAVSIAIAFPVGVWVGHLHRFSFIAVNLGNVLRALPTVAIIAVGIGLYGFGFHNIMVAMVVLAVPLILTNTYVAVEGVEPGIVEAARGMGLTGWQIVWRVELPNAIPLTLAGIRTAYVYVMATAYVGAFAGYSGTLGEIIQNQASYRLSGVMAAAVAAIVMAFAGDFLLARLERAITPRGLKTFSPTPVA